MDWTGRRVFLTGHTAFKGSWLALWLTRMGAEVHGYALDPPTTPAMFTEARVGAVLQADTRADLADLAALRRALAAARPEVVFHLAAQPLVRESYRAPRETFATNVMGTVNLLEAVRGVDTVRAVVVITTDKVYRNEEGPDPFREDDPLGGHDPYSASKAAAEIAVASWRASFFGGQGHPAQVASARAGNVIGGGDWAAERLVPDCLRAADAGVDMTLRYPQAVRPWQHVLEPLSGYLLLAERLLGADGADFARAWNFGPENGSEATVGTVADLVLAKAGRGPSLAGPQPAGQLHEAGLLRLDSTLAHTRLDWAPRWTLDRAVTETVAWHQAWRAGADMQQVSIDQIDGFLGTG